MAIRERGATSGAGVLATYAHDDLGRRTGIARGNGTSTSYQYDPVSRLAQLGHDLAGSTHDLTLTFAYNPASQIVSTTRSNDLYAWTGHGSGTTSSTANGLNQLAAHGGATTASDARGNLIFDGTTSYTYSSENLLTSFGPTGPLEYSPTMRFYKNYNTYFIHWGDEYLGEYYNGNIAGRYVPGPGVDEPLVQVDKFGNRIWLHADERGSVIAGSDASGAKTWISAYDEYGRRSGGGARLGYTGQFHLYGDVYDYKTRNYLARLGRFPQTDRIGYAGGMNLYAYVGGDPVNFVDPLGLEDIEICGAVRVKGECVSRDALLRLLKNAFVSLAPSFQSAAGHPSRSRGGVVRPAANRATQSQCPAVPASRPVAAQARSARRYGIRSVPWRRMRRLMSPTRLRHNASPHSQAIMTFEMHIGISTGVTP